MRLEEYDSRRINALYDEFVKSRIRGYGDYPTILGLSGTSFFDQMYERLESLEIEEGERSSLLYIINRYESLIGVALLSIRPKDRDRRILVPLSGKRFGFKSLKRSKYLEIKTLDEILSEGGPDEVIEIEKKFYETITMLPDRSREELIILGREFYVEPVHIDVVEISLDIKEINALFVGEEPSETLIPIAVIGPESALQAVVGVEFQPGILGVLPKNVPYPKRKFELYPYIQYINPTKIVYREG